MLSGLPLLRQKKQPDSPQHSWRAEPKSLTDSGLLTSGKVPVTPQGSVGRCTKAKGQTNAVNISELTGLKSTAPTLLAINEGTGAQRHGRGWWWGESGAGAAWPGPDACAPQSTYLPPLHPGSCVTSKTRHKLTTNCNSDLKKKGKEKEKPSHQLKIKL